MNELTIDISPLRNCIEKIGTAYHQAFLAMSRLDRERGVSFYWISNEEVDDKFHRFLATVHRAHRTRLLHIRP